MDKHQNIPFVQKGKRGFTLVELIIVITILAILAVIAFVSFQGVIIDTRDANRITTLKNIATGLILHKAEYAYYPKPEGGGPESQYLHINSGSGVLIKQGYIGPKTSQLLKFSKILGDPLDKKYYFYSLTGNEKYYQVGTFLENEKYLSVISSVYAGDFKKRHYYQIGERACIVFQGDNSILAPQEDDNFSLIQDEQIEYKIWCVGREPEIGTGGVLAEKIIEYQNSKPIENVPNNKENNCNLSDDETQTIILSDDDTTACFLN